MKLVCGQEEEMITINFLFLGMMGETLNNKENFLLDVQAPRRNNIAVPILGNAVREFLSAANWLTKEEAGISLFPCGLHLPQNPRIRIPKTNRIKNWDNVEAALLELTEKHTEGFKIAFERGEQCDEMIC